MTTPDVFEATAARAQQLAAQAGDVDTAFVLWWVAETIDAASHVAAGCGDRWRRRAVDLALGIQALQGRAGLDAGVRRVMVDALALVEQAAEKPAGRTLVPAA